MNNTTLIFLLLLTGCVTKHTAKLTAIESVSQSAMASRALAVVPQPPVLWLLWEKNDSNPQTVTEVWQTTDLQDWSLFGEFIEPPCVVTANQQQQFFKIRNRLGEEFSDWDRSGQ